jgi:flagellar M-ring protein FliF
MQQQLTRVRGAWSAMPARARYAIIGVAVATVLVLFLVLRAASSTTWTAVATDLPADKLGEAQVVLEEASIENRVSEDGTDIEVPEADAPKAANALIPAGIAATGSRAGCAEQSEGGSSLMAQTSAQHALMYETCRENDAANTIESLDGVEMATVDVALPGAELFAEDAEAATASVVIDTGGSSLSKDAVKGIQSTVAARFEGLEIKDVVITDETGEIIGGSGADDEATSSMQKIGAEAKYNAMVERELGMKIAAIVGEGNAVLTSNVELDMDTIERGVVDVEAAGEDGEQLVESENYEKELLNGVTETGVEGVAGTATNQGVDPDNRTVTPDVLGTNSRDGDYVGDKNAVNYANNIIEERIGVAPGSVTRFRLGVVVDDDVDAASANAVKDIVQAWMGGNAQDSLAFNQAPIAAARPDDSAAAASGRSSMIANYLKWALLGLGLISLAFVLQRSLKQRTAELLAPADDLLLLDGTDFTPIPIAELEAALAANQPSAERRGRLEMQRKVEQIADTKPNDVANELRRWMHQDDAGYAPARKAG